MSSVMTASNVTAPTQFLETKKEKYAYRRFGNRSSLATLSAIYSDRYMLVRPDGTVLNKEQVLQDLIEHKMAPPD